MLLQAENLGMRFGRREALRALTLGVKRGELLGVVGPDGAGKTTFIRLMAGVLSPTSGRVRSAVPRERVGYLSQFFSLYPDLTVWENVGFFGHVYGLHSQAVRRRGQYLLDWVGLWAFRHRLASQLSGGMRQKLSLACALIHEADLMLLDEPTTAVDPLSRKEFWDLIMDLVRRGTTVVVSTPYMDEADRCHRVAFLHEGHLLACDTPQGMRRQMKLGVLEIRAPGVDREHLEQTALSFPHAVSAHSFGDTVHLMVDGPVGEAQRQLLAYTSGLPGLSVREVSPSLEDVFIWMLSREEAKV